MNNKYLYSWKVAAYITAYKDEEALIQCIQSIQCQSYPLQKILIVDNSPVAFNKYVSNYHDSINFENIIIKHFPENIGVASGLSLGIEWAIKEEYDFLWTFDQDSEASENLLEDLLAKYTDLAKQKDCHLGLIAPLPINRITKKPVPGIIHNQVNFTQCQPHPNDTYYECDVVITSGSLISIPAAKQIPLPNADFFIDAVDYDYCLKLRKQGYKVIVVCSAILHHRMGLPEQVYSKLLKRKIYVTNYSPMRRYYICRNHSYLETRICNPKLLKISIKWRLRVMLDSIIEAIHEKDYRLLKVWACIRGTLDGFSGILGKNW